MLQNSMVFICSRVQFFICMRGTNKKYIYIIYILYIKYIVYLIFLPVSLPIFFIKIVA